MEGPLQRVRGIDLSRRNRLVVYYLTGLVVLVLAYAVVYNVTMARLEGVDQSLLASVEFVVQTMTTTGYGQDSGVWSHPVTFLFVILTQLSGIGLGFFTLRLVVIPLFTGAEVDLDSRLTPKSDHVIICEYSRDSAVLLNELEELDIEYVLLTSSRAEATELSDAGYAAIHGSPQDESTFERASIDTARAVITDTGDATVNTILTIRAIRSEIDIVSLTDDSDRREVLLETGADTVLSPHGVLGRRLAEKAVSSFSTDLIDTVDLGGDIEVAEVPVDHGSPLIGTRIRNSNIREETGATIIGAWIDGELQLPPDPAAVIRANTVLLMSGGHAELAAFSEFSQPVRTRSDHDRIVIAGHGEVGQAARETVDETGIETTVIDREAGEAVAVVGDATTEATLAEASIGTADALIIGLADDSSALLTTVLARSLNDEMEILLRVSDTDATRKALSAGADYALSVPRVSARMIARELRGEDVLAPASQVRFIRAPATPLAGTTLAESNIYERTGCRVIAVEDDDGISATVDPTRTFDGDERLTLVGTDEAIQAFHKRYDVPEESS